MSEMEYIAKMVADYDRGGRAQIVYNGPVVVICHEGRLFLHSRANGGAYEVIDGPDGITAHAL